MSETPFSLAESLRIGAVDFVSPDELRVMLDIEAPDSVALNSGGARPFPRINGYALVPIDDGFVVGQIEWLTIERSSFPKRRGVKDFGVIDLPYPLRKLCLNPLGTLRKANAKAETYSFRRGAGLLPTVGSAVLLPTNEQLRSIVESGDNRRVRIGVSPLAENAEVSIDPDRMFGRHLAVLGNTGSGKSCTVAGLIRWSLEAAKRERESSGATAKPNARFVILDPNGEYARAFHNEKDKSTARVFKLDPGDSEHPLHVPLWFWNSAEWSSFTQATAKTQKPLLRRALRDVKAGRGVTPESTYDEQKLVLRRYLTTSFVVLRTHVQQGTLRSDSNKTGKYLSAVATDLASKRDVFADVPLVDVENAIGAAVQPRFRIWHMVQNNEGLTKTYNRFHDPHEQSEGILELRRLHGLMDGAVLRAYGWDDLAESARCECLLDYEEEEDEDETGKKKSKKKKPWRYRWPDEFRDEVLARLLELNEQRHQEELLSGTPQKDKSVKAPKSPKKRSKSDAPLFPNDADAEAPA